METISFLGSLSWGMRIVVLLVVGCSTVGVFLGLANKAVFFKDRDDVLLALKPPLVLLLARLLADTFGWSWALPVGWVVATLDVVALFIRTLRVNRCVKSLAALFVFPAKVFLGVVLVANAAGVVLGPDTGSRLLSLLWLVLLGLLCTRLVNGKRVVIVRRGSKCLTTK